VSKGVETKTIEEGTAGMVAETIEEVTTGIIDNLTAGMVAGTTKEANEGSIGEMETQHPITPLPTTTGRAKNARIQILVLEKSATNVMHRVKVVQ
jgi:hypothetical protein